MIGAPMHPHAAARGYSRPAPDPIVAPAQSSREGSAGIRVRARNARLTQGTGLWKLPQPCKWEWWPSTDFLLIISTAACKSFRKTRSRLSHSYTQAGGDLSQ